LLEYGIKGNLVSDKVKHLPDSHSKLVCASKKLIQQFICQIHVYFMIRDHVKGENDLTELEDKVREEVGKVPDPETGMTFAEMQMITNVKEEEPGVVKVEFIPSSPFCPIAFKLASDLKNAAKKVPGVKKALVYCRGHAMEQQINEMTNK
jgi:metal-sulfur cluster biosynthetic enzyme